MSELRQWSQRQPCLLLAAGWYSGEPQSALSPGRLLLLLLLLLLRCSNWKIASDLICISGPDRLTAKAKKAALVKFLGTMGLRVAVSLFLREVIKKKTMSSASFCITDRLQ